MSDPEGRGDGEIRAVFGAVTEQLEPGVLLVRLAGELDIATTELAAEAIRAAVAPPARLVLIDVSAVTFCSSAGLGNLLEARQLAGAYGIELAVVGAGRPIDRPLTATGLGTRFRIFASPAEALRSLTGR
jgi:anti-sigma B factor antagonist